MGQNITISKELFMLLTRNFLELPLTEEERQTVYKGLQAKLEAMAKREAYTAYKASETPVKASEALKEYIALTVKETGASTPL